MSGVCGYLNEREGPLGCRKLTLTSSFTSVWKYDQQIMTPRQLFDWAAKNVPATFFEYCSLNDYKKAAIFLEKRFKQAHTLPGTQRLHSFTPVSKTKIGTKVFNQFKEERVTICGDELTLEEITGFIMCT